MKGNTVPAPGKSKIAQNEPNEALFYALLKADTEDDVTKILTEAETLSCDDDWKSLGEFDNNWSLAGNQQSAAAAALVEKLINGIDSVLIYECLKRRIDPTSPGAPQSMAEAAKEFFKVPSGRLENIQPRDRSQL